MKLKILEINLTPLITQPFLDEMKNTYKKVKIIRNIIKMTDPTDDGLRMPLLANKKKKKKGKKKKKKKWCWEFYIFYIIFEKNDYILKCFFYIQNFNYINYYY